MIPSNISKTTKLISSAVHYLKQQKLRAALSVLGVVCGVMAVFAMICIGVGAKREALRQIEQLGVANIIIQAKPLTQAQRIKAIGKLSRGLAYSDGIRIKNILSTVADFSTLKEVRASVVGMQTEFTPQIVAVSSSYADTLGLQLTRGRFVVHQDMAQKNMVAVLGHSLARKMGAEGTIGKSMRIENTEFKIVGVLEPRHLEKTKSFVISPRDYNQMIFIPKGTEMTFADVRDSQKLFNRDNITELIIRIKRTDQVLKSADVIKRIMAVSHSGVEDYSLIIPQELLKKVREAQRTFNIVLGAIAGVSLIVGGIGIMNIMLATISERRKEIGIRRAVGATRKHIWIQFLAEAVILTTIGGVLGLIAGFLFVSLVAALSGWETAVVPSAVVLSLFMAITVGIFSGLYPAILAAKTDPIEALRTV